MAEGYIDNATEWVKNLASSATDATTNAAKSGAEGVRSFAQDITLEPDDIVLLETNPKFQMGTEVIDGKLNPAEQNKLAQKVIQNFKTRREIDGLLNEIKTAQLRSLVKSYVFPEHEKGTELRPSTSKDDVGMFVDNSFGAIKAIGKGVIDTTTPWGDTPNERIDNLQKEVILQAKRTRFAVHNMIAQSPEWLANPSLGFSPMHDSSGITSPYMPWNSLADRNPNTIVWQSDIVNKTRKHPLENLESIIDVMVDTARNPKHLDQNLNQGNASIVVPGEITDTTRKFGTDYENELLFALQFLQAMEKGADEADTGMIMGAIKDHPLFVWVPAWAFVCYLLVRYGLIAPLKKLTPGGKIGKLLIPIVAGAEYVGSELQARTAKNKAKIAEITGETTGGDSKSETVEWVKVPKHIAEEANNALKKLRETKAGDAIFDTVEIHEDASATRHTGVDLDDPERLRRIKYITTKLQEFSKGKIDEESLLKNVREGFDGSYIYNTKAALIAWVDPTTLHTKAGIRQAAGAIGSNFAARLQRKAMEKTGLGWNLEAVRTGKALANADKLEPYTFGTKEWNLNNSADSKSIVKELEVILAQKERLENAQELLWEAKDKRLALESIEAKLAKGGIEPKLKTGQVVVGAHSSASTKVEGEIENPTYTRLLADEKEARKELGDVLKEIRKTGVIADGINTNGIKVTSTSIEIDAVLTQINSKFTNAAGLNNRLGWKLTELGIKNKWSIIPSFSELKWKTLAEAMPMILHSVGKIKVEAKI